MSSCFNEKSKSLEMESTVMHEKKVNSDHSKIIEEKDDFLSLNDKNAKLKDTEDIDYILEHFVGCGKWNDIGQWILFTAIIVIAYCGIFPIFMHVYAAYEPRHRCFIPNCEESNTTSNIDVNWISISSPAINTKTEQMCQAEMLKEDEYFDPCHRYEIKNLNLCEEKSFNKSNIQRCEKFVYDKSIVEESLTTKFDLVCDLEYQQMMLGVMVMLGLMIGSPLGGLTSDKLGRKNAMIISVLVIVPTVMFAGYSTNFWMYAILKLINTIALPCLWFTSHTLVTEIFGKDYRQNAVVLKEIMWPLGMLLIIGVFYLTRHWVYFHLWIGGLCALTIPAFMIVPESPRWLSVNGKWEAAEIILLRMAKWNRRNLSHEEKQKINSILRKLDGKVDFEQEKSLGIRDLLSSENFRNTLVMTMNWIIVVVTSFTLAFNVTKLTGDVFVNSTLLTMFGDIPGKFFMWLTLKFCSRRFSLFLFQCLCGLVCIIIAFLPKNYELAVIAFYMLAMCASNAAFGVVYLITGELYPTNLRTRAIGTCSTISRIFGISASFMSKLSCIWKPLPMLVLGLPSILIGCSVYFLPETKKKNLPLATKHT